MDESEHEIPYDQDYIDSFDLNELDSDNASQSPILNPPVISPPTILSLEKNTNNSQTKSNNKRKKKYYPLSLNAIKFRTRITNLFGKRIPKKLLIKYHRMVQQRFKKINPIKRCETRVIKTYLNQHAFEQDNIIAALSKLIIEGVISLQ